MEEVANIKPLVDLPGSITREEIDTHDWRAILQLRRLAMNICQYKITENYISAVFNKLKAHKSTGFIYKQGEIIMGFVIYYIDTMPLNMEGIQPHKFMYVPLLCAQINKEHLGSAIINDMDIYCRRNKLKYIRLHPANKSLYRFYERNGFISIQTDPQLEMMKEIYPLVKITYSSVLPSQTRRQRRHTAKRIIEHISINSNNERTPEFLANIQEKYNQLPE